MWRRVHLGHFARPGFTLVELIVVVGVIALLLTLLMPALAGVRRSADRSVCSAELRQVGMLLQMYMADSRGRLPRVNTMPSLRPLVNNAPSLVRLLEPYARTSKVVYRCPSDRITVHERKAPKGYFSYFEREQSSYQYNPPLSSLYGGKRLENTPFYRHKVMYLLPTIWDYEAFHGKAGEPGSMNYLFTDGHVGDLVLPR